MVKQSGLRDGAEDVTSGDLVTNSDLRIWGEVPLLIAIESGDRHTSGNKHITGMFCDLFKGALDAVKNITKKTRTEFDGKWSSGPFDGVAYGETGSLLIDLNSGGRAREADNLTKKLERSDSNELVHSGTIHLIGSDDWSCDFSDDAFLRNSVRSSASHCELIVLEKLVVIPKSASGLECRRW